MTAAKTRSQLGKMSRNKGAAFQKHLARAIRPWYPDARSGRDNGSAHTTDAGDLAETSPDLYWSLKDDAAGFSSPPGLIAAWMAEAREKANGKLPLLVQKRRGHADPLMSWCWLPLDELVHLRHGYRPPQSYDAIGQAPVRLELRSVLLMLTDSGLAHDPTRTEETA